jgi:hypothetical protein
MQFPSKLSVATTILIPMTIYGGATQFTPSAEWWSWGFVSAGVATVATTIALATTGYFRRPARDTSSFLGHAAKVCAVICMFFLVSYLVVGRAVPALGTLLLAPDIRLEATLEREKHKVRKSRRSSDRTSYNLHIRLETLDTTVEYRLKDPADYERVLTWRTAGARIRKSWFGLHVLELEAYDGPPGARSHLSF